MQITVSLNAGAADAADIRTALDAELRGLEQQGLQITTQKKPIETGALALAEAYQFILEYGPGLAKAIPLVTAVLQLSNAVLQRRGITGKKKPKTSKKASTKNTQSTTPQPVVVVQMEGKSIDLPAEPAQLKKFVSSFSNPEKSSRKPAAKAKKATTQSKKRATKR
jgi:hypothetical protein